MDRKPKKLEEKKKGAPAYMVSFGDMMTLMLTFFILLCTFAKRKEAGFIAAGIGSFRRAINSFGLPGVLPSDTDALRLKFMKSMSRFNKKYPSSLEEWKKAEEDQVNLNTEKLKASIKDYMGEQDEAWISTPITFQKGEKDLQESHRGFLRKIAPLLRSGKWKIVIEGFAEEDEEPDPWNLSLARAIEVVRYLGEEEKIDMARLLPMGMGPSHPISEEEASQENRRVGILITKKK